MHDETLTHYGIKGMRWGHRKPEEPSSHQVRLEAEYLKKGSSSEEAKRLAERRMKGEKYALAIGGTLLLAGASYVAYKEVGKRFASVNLKVGTELKYINALGDAASLDRRLYTTYLDSDTKKYKGLLATTLRKNATDTTIYETVLKTTKDIKAPSNHEAKKLFADFKRIRMLDKKLKYNQFNTGLIDGDNPVNVAFFNFLKSKGYNAVLDANDQFLSGYDTKRPLILFNAASSAVKTGQSIVEKELSERLNQRQMIEIAGKQFAPVVALGAAYCGGAQAMKTAARRNAAQSYVNRHPGTYSLPEIYNAVVINPSTGLASVDPKKLGGTKK